MNKFPAMKFFPANAQQVMDVVDEVRIRYPILLKSTSLDNLKLNATRGNIPEWFVIVDDPEYFAYCMTDSCGPMQYIANLQKVQEYELLDIPNFTHKPPVVKPAVEHPHADLIEWYMSDESNEIEHLNVDGEWSAATTPTWSSHKQYRRAPRYDNTPRIGRDAVVAWVRDQSTPLQVKFGGNWAEFNMENGDARSFGRQDIRIYKPTELELQAKEILANPDLLALIKRGM